MRTRLALLTASVIVLLTAQTPGKYAGSWASNSSGNSGKLTLTFTDKGLGNAAFTLEGEEVIAKPVAFKSEANQLDFTFEYEVDGSLLRTRMQGVETDKAIKGKYLSMPAGGGDPVDEGTWEVKAQ